MTQTRRSNRICDLRSLTMRSVLKTYLTPKKENHLAPHIHVGIRNGDFDSQSRESLHLADRSISLHDAAMNEQVSPGSTETRLLNSTYGLGSDHQICDLGGDGECVEALRVCNIRSLLRRRRKKVRRRTPEVYRSRALAADRGTACLFFNFLALDYTWHTVYEDYRLQQVFL